MLNSNWPVLGNLSGSVSALNQSLVLRVIVPPTLDKFNRISWHSTYDEGPRHPLSYSPKEGSDTPQLG